MIAAGPCPGSWRVFYAATKNAEQYTAVNSDRYLGIQLEGKLTTHELGKMFEGWVNQANEAFNSFLVTGNLSSLAPIQGTLGGHYQTEGAAILNSSTQAERETCKMDVSPEFQLSIKPPVEVNPDGLFPHGRFGAVFESKLSEPMQVEFVHLAAIYALASEKAKRIDVNYAIVLHSDFPNEHPTSMFKEIPDSAIERVTSNLESFLHLLQSSEVQRVGLKQRLLRFFQGASGVRLKSWKDFVKRPPGLPERDLRGPCPKCRYKEFCFKDGGEPGGWASN